MLYKPAPISWGSEQNELLDCLSIPPLPRQPKIEMSQHEKQNADDAQLAALGLQPELKRTFSPLAMLGLAFAILNSWTALSASLSLALPSGGPTSVLWGLISMCLYTCFYKRVGS